jgi:hypothetical protein
VSTIADYQGRTYDVMAFQGVAPEGDVLLTQSLFSADTAGEIATGVQKLAQRFLLELLRDVGSMPFQPLRGSSFLPEFRAGHMRTDLDVASAFTLAVGEVQTQIQQMETKDDPDDERFASAELGQVVINLDAVSLHINVYSKAGTSRLVILPLATAVRN